METASNPSRIRALFFDLDGTLLTSSKTLSESTALALEACRGSGIGIFVATARPPTLDRQLSMPPGRMALLSDGGVFYNGALVRVRGMSEYRFLPPRTVRAIIDAAWRRPEVNVALQRSGERHAFRYPLLGDGFRLWGMRGLRPPDFVPFPGPGDAPEDVAKIVLFGAEDPMRQGADLTGLHDALRGAVSREARLYLTDRGTVIQAMEAGVSKKTGVDRAVRLAGLSAAEVAVFGDDVNDREMLASYPHSVAMGNADGETRALAAHVTRGNDGDGIAHALREILRVLPGG
jgi:hydroxymethylpyrimidine pyrophosphatase-like HAD family hydrolase